MTETVTTSTVLGSANPVASKIRALGNSIQGIGCGIILLIVGVILIYQSVNGVKEYSKIVAALDLKTPVQATANEDLIKLSAKTDNVSTAEFSYVKCVTKVCDPATALTQKFSDMLYYSVEFERFEVVKNEETETSTRTDANGNTVEDKTTKTTYSEEWVNIGTIEDWATFYMGSVKVVPNDRTRIISDLDSETVNLVKTDNTLTVDPLNTYGQTVSDAVGSVRLIINFLPVSDINFIVVGSLQNGQITAGDPFIVTDKSDSELIKSLQTAETTERTIYLIGSWVLTFLGLSMLFAPIVELVSFIPFTGGAAKAVAGIVSAILATLMVLGGWLLIKFWWVFLLLLVGLIVLAVYLIKNRKPKGK